MPLSESFQVFKAEMSANNAISPEAILEEVKTPPRLRPYRVAVFPGPNPTLRRQWTAYLRDYYPSSPGCCMHTVQAATGSEAKKAAIAACQAHQIQEKTMLKNTQREGVISHEAEAETQAEATQVVVMFSGGAASAVAALRAKERYGASAITLLFCDTLIEDEDTYRFLEDAAQWLGIPLTRLADGRTPWEVFRDERYLGNTRADPCSKILKRQLADQWVTAHTTPEAIIVLGLDACELHRAARVRQAYLPRQVELPLLWQPFLDKDACRAILRHEGIREPRLYGLGFAHNNCGGFYVKGGHAQFRHLLKTLPERYVYHEGQESALREYLGKPVSILRDRKGGRTLPLTLAQFRQGVSSSQEEFWGGCGCFTDDNNEES